MTRKNISIALCTYNGESFLNEQLDSFCRQTRLPDELIVCDDGSRDATVELIEDFISKAPFPVRFYKNNRNLGFAKNFEQALSLCGGDIIALSDQDDIWSEERLARFEQIFINDPTLGYAFCDAIIIDDKLNKLDYTFWDKYGALKKQERNYLPGEFTKVLFGKMSSVAGCLLVVNSDILKLTLPLPEQWNHDDWIPFAGSIFKSVTMIPDKLTYYRLHPSQSCGIILKKTSRARYLSLVQGWENARLRILEDERFLPHRTIVSHIDAKIQHLIARGQMPQDHLKRLPSILRETVSLRYFKYSSGLKSVARDLLLD